MHQLIYQSTLRATLSQEELETLASEARLKNQYRNITSLMLVQDRTVLHILEGPKKAVRNLYDKISTDPNHEDCFVLISRETEKREFGQDGFSLRPVDVLDAAPFRQTLSTLKARQRSRIRDEARAMIADFAMSA